MPGVKDACGKLAGVGRCDWYPAVLLPERPGHELDWKVSFDETRSGGKLICSVFTCHEDTHTHTHVTLS